MLIREEQHKTRVEVPKILLQSIFRGQKLDDIAHLIAEYSYSIDEVVANYYTSRNPPKYMNSSFLNFFGRPMQMIDPKNFPLPPKMKAQRKDVEANEKKQLTIISV